MTIPDRASLPAEFVAVLEQHDAEKARSYGRKPVLPADETPQVLVDAAVEFDRLLGVEIAKGERGAEVLNLYMRRYIDAALRRELVEPATKLGEPIDLHGTGFRGLRDLHEAYAYFVALLDGRDNSPEPQKASYRKLMVIRRKHFAEEFRVDLDLTDEEWWEL